MRKTKGTTLIEALSVITIIASIIYFCLLQYLAIRDSFAAEAVRNKANEIFAAMDQYYQKNCYGTDTQPGTLNPRYQPNPTVKPNFAIDINNDLHIVAPDFIAQFNLESTPRYICAKAIDPNKAVTGNLPTQNCLETKLAGQVLSWQPQVAYRLKGKHKNQQLKLLRALCLSMENNGIVEPCVNLTSAEGDFAVWERNYSTHPILNAPYIRRFTQRYRNYPNQEFICND